MSTKIFKILIIAGTVLSIISLGLVLFYFDPEKAGIFGLIMFYATLFLSLFGLFFLAANYFKSLVFKKQQLIVRLRNSVRHAVLFSILILVWAFLNSLDLIRWWNLLLLILILTALEFFFISTQKNRNYERPTPKTAGTIQPRLS